MDDGREDVDERVKCQEMAICTLFTSQAAASRQLSHCATLFVWPLWRPH
jgi:hypothetical protein